jgi:isopentenyl phosphate kinase
MTDKVVIFLKLGGSLITDKTAVESVRSDVLERVAHEIGEARESAPNLQLVVGHGSGSFGHVAAAKYGTRQGVRTREEWTGFAQVSDSAARLNALVRKVFLGAGIPTLTLQTSASAFCQNGKILSLASKPIELALKAGLVPLIYGDVAYDGTLGGTIISTEEIMSYLTPILRPRWLLLAGETQGVFGSGGELVTHLNKNNIEQIQANLTGSRGTDVTGGMQSKVTDMLKLVGENTDVSVLIFSGLEMGLVRRAILQDPKIRGTVISTYP